MSLKKICQQNVITVFYRAPVIEAAKIMRDNHVGDLIVMDGMNGLSRPIGILTDRDITKFVATHIERSNRVAVEDIMSRRLITAKEETGLYEAVALMRMNGVRRLPIVDNEGKLVGIITADDVLQILASEMKNIAGICQQQIENESKIETLTARFQL